MKTKVKFPLLERIVIDSPGTVIDHNWLDILLHDPANRKRGKKVLKELRDITCERTNKRVFDKYEGFTVEEMLLDGCRVML